MSFEDECEKFFEDTDVYDDDFKEEDEEDFDFEDNLFFFDCENYIVGKH